MYKANNLKENLLLIYTEFLFLDFFYCLLVELHYVNVPSAFYIFDKELN